jgi:hypothetical protein
MKNTTFCLVTRLRHDDLTTSGMGPYPLAPWTNHRLLYYALTSFGLVSGVFHSRMASALRPFVSLALLGGGYAHVFGAYV